MDCTKIIKSEWHRPSKHINYYYQVRDAYEKQIYAGYLLPYLFASEFGQLEILKSIGSIHELTKRCSLPNVTINVCMPFIEGKFTIQRVRLKIELWIFSTVDD